MLNKIIVTPSPHISKSMSTRSVMLDVVIGLVPAMLAAAYYFRSRALVLIGVCVITAVGSEWLCNLIRKRSRPGESLGDFSAVVTGIILALSLPPAIPIWTAIVGSAFSIVIGKMVFGGLGANVFNPAMVGRTFLTASFGLLMTTWSVPATIDPNIPDISAQGTVDVRTQATPLNWSKQAIKADGPDQRELRQEFVRNVDDNLTPSFVGATGGCLGETSALALIIGGIYLLIRKTISFHIPAATLIGAFLFALITRLANPTGSISPLSHLCSGALLLGAFFIATDPVTAPLTRRGMWIFGLGVGLITILIRVVGEYPEGFMYAILLMNAVTPLIDRLCKRVPAGGKPNV